jgi:hypothetical protein
MFVGKAQDWGIVFVVIGFVADNILMAPIKVLFVGPGLLVGEYQALDTAELVWFPRGKPKITLGENVIGMKNGRVKKEFKIGY